MSRRSHHGRNKEAPELDITAFLNLMVVLVPFLLVSAVFSRITILELNIPTAAGASQPSKVKLRGWKLAMGARLLPVSRKKMINMT